MLPYYLNRAKWTRIVGTAQHGAARGGTVFGSTMLLTIGQALDRAKDEDLTVRMNVGGDWISGRILANDPQAIAVLETSGDLCVIRKDTISCVRMPAQADTKYVPNQQPDEVDLRLGILEQSEAIHV